MPNLSYNWDSIFLIFLGTFLIIGAIVLNLPEFHRDDADPPLGQSGLMLLTDYGTGCQYLYYRGNLIPRADASGKQICKK